MELVSSETTLVVAGAWNTSIINPAWMIQHGLDDRAAAQPARVQIFMPAIQGGMLEFPRFTLEQFTYTVSPGALVLAPIGDPPQSFEIAEEALTRVLRTLVHTPISGVGHNFEFRDPAPQAGDVAAFTNARQDIVDAMPPGWTPASTALHSTFANGAGNVQVNIQRQSDNGVLTVKFNFHHVATDAQQAIAVLTGAEGRPRMAANLELARRLINTLYLEARA